MSDFGQSFNKDDYRIYIDRPVNIDAVTIDIYQYANGKSYHAQVGEESRLRWVEMAPMTMREHPTIVLMYPLSEVFLNALQKTRDKGVEDLLREMLVKEQSRVDATLEWMR